MPDERTIERSTNVSPLLFLLTYIGKSDEILVLSQSDRVVSEHKITHGELDEDVLKAGEIVH